MRATPAWRPTRARPTAAASSTRTRPHHGGQLHRGRRAPRRRARPARRGPRVPRPARPCGRRAPARPGPGPPRRQADRGGPTRAGRRAPGRPTSAASSTSTRPTAAADQRQLDQGHADRGGRLDERHLHQRQVEDLAALHPGHRPPGQASPAPAAAARLMAHVPVRPGHLRQHAALMPVLPAGLTAAFLPQRPRPRRLPQPRLKRSDPLPGLRQLAQCLHQRSLRPGQLPTQRGHQRGHHLISGTSIIPRHTRTLLPPRITRAATPHHRGSASAARSQRTWREGLTGHSPSWLNPGHDLPQPSRQFPLTLMCRAGTTWPVPAACSCLLSSDQGHGGRRWQC
jgi:hypothetical protein